MTTELHHQPPQTGLALEGEAVTFAYQPGKPPVVDQVSLQVPQGSSFGLLGQNGAGKSTLLKLMSGLLRPSEGGFKLLGHPISQHRDLSVLQRLGALIEDPPLYPHLSGYDNLKASTLYRNLPAARIGEVLEQVQMTAAASRKTGSYSTGMKQRLGIALALLPDPEVLILDEPVNGLDPQGIVIIRHLLKQLQQQGKTLIVSSHLLHEIELSCNYVGILQQGRLLYQGSIDALKARQSTVPEYRLRTDNNQQAKHLLDAQGFACQQQEPYLQVHITHKKDVTHLIDLLRQSQIAIEQVTPIEVTLEDLYLQLTQQHP